MAEIVAVDLGGQMVDAKKLSDPVRNDIKRAREAQKAFHPTWALMLAFAAGEQWLGVRQQDRTLRHISEIDPRYKGRELYQADIITESRLAILGEMGSDDDRPELLLVRDDQAAEDFQAAVNRAIGFGWDHQWDGDGVLAEVDRLTLDLGTSAVRCRFDPTIGKVAYQGVPHMNGQPIPREQAYQAAAAAVMGQGDRPEYKDVPEGRICWQPYSAFGILPPTGVTHERYFPFDCLVEPKKLSEIKAMYPEIAADLKEDGDISSTLGQAVVGAPGAGPDKAKNRLRGHVWYFCYFQRPSPAAPQGRTYHFAGNELRLLDVKDGLPYRDANGDPCSGIVYFHWQRVTGRFFSRSLVEALKDVQRAKNKRATQRNEIIDRGMPAYFAQKGSTAERKTGAIMERIDLDPGEPQPTIFQGFGPGDWMYREDEQLDKEATRSTGITAPTLGENPASVTNYSQLSLLREQSQVKRQPIYIERKLAIAKLVELSVYDIRTYWGPEKNVMLAGDDERIEAEVFNATKIPDFYVVRVAKGAAKPRSQAGELQKIQDIWTAAVAAGAVVAAPDQWVNWFKASLEHGQPLDLPDSPSDDQEHKAEIENHMMLAGIQIMPRYWENVQVHVLRHRQAQIQADEVGDIAAYELLEAHIQAHLQLQVQNSIALQSGAPPGESPSLSGMASPPQQASPSPQEAAPAPAAPPQ